VTLLNEYKLSAINSTNLVLACHNESLREESMRKLNLSLKHYKEIMELLNDKGYYQIEPASLQEIEGVQKQVDATSLASVAGVLV